MVTESQCSREMTNEYDGKGHAVSSLGEEITFLDLMSESLPGKMFSLWEWAQQWHSNEAARTQADYEIAGNERQEGTTERGNFQKIRKQQPVPDQKGAAVWEEEKLRPCGLRKEKL